MVSVRPLRGRGAPERARRAHAGRRPALVAGSAGRSASRAGAARRTDTRIAYLSGGELRVVGGDGKGDRLLDNRAARSAPSWKAWAWACARLCETRRNRPCRRRRHRSGARPGGAGRRLTRGRRSLSPALARRWSIRGAGRGRPTAGGSLWAGPRRISSVFLRVVGREQIRAVSNVSSQFRSSTFPQVEGWCCAAVDSTACSGVTTDSRPSSRSCSRTGPVLLLFYLFDWSPT